MPQLERPLEIPMSTQDKEKWDAKYEAGAFTSRPYPGVFLKESLDSIKKTLEEVGMHAPWRALDIACGAGRNTHFLSCNGFQVDAVDISATGLQRAAENTPTDALNINWHQHDLDHGLPTELLGEHAGYHLIVMMRYVNLALLRTLPDLLAPNGYLICEEHLQTDQAVSGPKSQRFRVAPGDLETHTRPLAVEHIREGLIQDPDGEAACVARILSKKVAE